MPTRMRNESIRINQTHKQNPSKDQAKLENY